MELAPSTTEWIKFGKIKLLAFIGRDIICIGSGCHMLFINIITGKEIIYRADNKAVGEGVCTFAGHKYLTFFAFAEKCRFPRVFIMTVPGFKRICILNKETNEDYMAIEFSEGELIVTINDSPSYVVIIWNWRTGEKIGSMKSDIFGKYQLSRCSASSPMHFSQLLTGRRKLNVWDIYACGNKCILTPHRIEPPKECDVFSDAVWTSEGTLVLSDISGSVYELDSNYELQKIIKWDGRGKTVTSLAWWKNGLAVAGPDGFIKHFTKSVYWICDWETKPVVSLKWIVSNYKDTLVGISEYDEILQYDIEENSFKFIKRYHCKFNDMCLIYPTGEYFLTLQHYRQVIAWELASGKMRDVKILNGKALAIKENPEYPYVGIAYNHGVLELLSVVNPDAITTMASFNLSKKPLNNIYFSEVGKLIVTANMEYGEFFIIEGIPGSKMEIIATVEAHRQICDYILVASRTCLRLFALYVTSNIFLAGNTIVRFCIVRGKTNIETKEYKFEYKCQMYSKLYTTTKVNRDRIFYAIPLTTKCIHELSTKRGNSYARVTNILHTGHQMKKILLNTDKHHAITYSYDGLVIIRSTDFQKVIAIVMPHYRAYGGVKKAYVSPLTKYVVSLGRDNALIGTTLTKISINDTIQDQLQQLLNSTRMVLMFKRRTIGFSPTGEYEGITWSEMNKINQERCERQQSEIERFDILETFKEIQDKLQYLLTRNLKGPKDEKLDIQEFNLDIALKEETINKSKAECIYTKVYLEALMVANNKVSDWIIKYCWNAMSVQGQQIAGVFTNYEVHNYVLLHPNQADIHSWPCMLAYRKLECQMAKKDIFEPWIPKTESKLKLQLQCPPSIVQETEETGIGLLEDDDHIDEESIDSDTDTAFKGSVSHIFVELVHGHYAQQQISSSLQAQIDAIFCRAEAKRLKLFFNKQFDDMMNHKVKEMSLTHERIARLRHILSELNYFRTNKLNIIIQDPEWTLLENPDSVLRVEDKEVGITPYISPSEQAILDAIAAEEERIRLLLLADDFRERALMIMMNGVLEVRWEDELKKDVPIPKCMLDKLPEQWNEEDMRTVMVYEKDVKFLNSERERYRKLLELEYGKLSNTVRDSIKKFNKRLTDFNNIKLQADSGIRQEILKLSRMRLISLKKILLDNQQKEILNEIANNKIEIEAIQSLIHSLQAVFQELKQKSEALYVKDKQLEKAFKKDFNETSPFVQEQSAKLYRKRPKIGFRDITSVTLLLQLSKSLISHERSLLLTQECLDYLQALAVQDQYINLPPVIDENIFAAICKHRRIKIENELKIKASALKIAEAENTIQTFQKLLHSKKGHGQELVLNLEQVRNDKLYLMQNIELQLILRKGIVEVPTSGRISDFDEVIMVCRKDVETINMIILKGGNRKLKAMRETMNFRRGILAMEWAHRCLRMQIEDLHTHIADIESMKITKEIQRYLKFKARGLPGDIASFEEELDITRGSYERLINDKKSKIMELQKRIDQLNQENTGTAKDSLNETIKQMNVDLCDIGFKKDNNLENSKIIATELRTNILVKRSQLIRKIQKNHADILVYQTELELKRLKTYPTFSYKILP